MADPSDKAPQVSLLIYDGQCRLCVTAKKGLERLETQPDASPIRMVAYQSEAAKQALGQDYRPGRPAVAFLVQPNGAVSRGLDAFLALLPGLKGGRILSGIFGFPLVKPIGYLLYRLVARYRYAVFGTVALGAPPDSPDKSSGESRHS